MFLKNYTSEVPVSQTIYKIEQVLIKAGVNGIAKEYGPTGKVSAISFQIKVGETPTFNIRLPADEVAATQALWLNYANGDKLAPDGNSLVWNNRKSKRRADFVEQGERTAWKLIQDWVEVQISMIQMKQADFVQVFMPYVVLEDGQTVYQRLKGDGFKQLQLAERN